MKHSPLDFARRLKNGSFEKWKIVKDFIWFARKQFLYNASLSTDKDISKMRYTILRENHVIEKGMSMRNTKEGFGTQKVSALLGRLHKYYALYGGQDPAFLYYPLSTIGEYIRYTHGHSTVDITAIEQAYKDLCGKCGTFEAIDAGITNVTATGIKQQANGDFKSLLYSRHSIRYFKKQEPDADKPNKALELAQRTPSACNRQGWLTHVYMGDDCYKFLEWQGGARGFERDIHACILVTANIKAFLSYEIYQAYIDGGMYAMNLINSLHFVGFGTIPLSCGFHSDKLAKLKQFNIPENEVPIVIIGFGELYDEFKIAISTRKDVSKTNKFEKL